MQSSNRWRQMRFRHFRRREIIPLLGGAAAAWSFAAHAQGPAVPVVGFLSGRSQEESARDAAAFRQGLNEMGYVAGRNVALEAYCDRRLYRVWHGDSALGSDATNGA